MLGISKSSKVNLFILSFVLCSSCATHKIKFETKQILDGFVNEYLSLKETTNIQDRYLFVQLDKADTNFVKNSTYVLNLYCQRKEHAISIKYDRLYTYGGFPLIIYDTVYENQKIKSLFKKIPYENINLGKKEYFVDGVPYWSIFLNKKLEIEMVLPQCDTSVIRNILETKDLKFSITYNKINN